MGSVIEHAELAERDKGKQTPAAETSIGVSLKQRIVRQPDRAIVWLEGLGGQVAGENGIVGRKGRGDDFVNADAGPGEGLIDSMDEAGGIAYSGAVNDGGLFHASLQFAHANDFEGIIKPAAELLFRTGTTGGKQGSEGQGGKKVCGVTHTINYSAKS